ncbi:hypothetical protein FA95DRAFT_1229197 [Auriscalpium vulgare]|uniref:Uncharacterized protein n=1 Tax=Auriscalpium vulgare TaxID=40419 RepID=A0ACB8R2N0_9AGAM|nr:hypothetical protein FA95DRAFT_1229197 [Auriscalpium vulgare]
MSKPVLYTFEYSVWSAAPELAIGELELTDAIEFKRVDLIQGENFEPSFVKINPNATLPTITADGKAYTNTTDVVDFLVKKSSVKVATRTAITTAVHEEPVDPTFALFASRDDAELARVAGGFGGTVTNLRLAGLKKIAATPEAQANKAFYDGKIATISELSGLLAGTAPAEAKESFFKTSKAALEAVKVFYLETLPASIGEGPFIGGATPGEDDFHVTAWLAHIAFILGAGKTEDGLAALEKGLAPPSEKVVNYWNAWSGRKGWAATYPGGNLH